MGSVWIWFIEDSDGYGRNWMFHGLICPGGRACWIKVELLETCLELCTSFNGLCLLNAKSPGKVCQ